MGAGETKATSFASPDAVSHDSMAPITFWLGFPVVLGLFSGWNQIGMIAPYLTLAWSMIYWLLLAAIMWSGVGLGTALVSRVATTLPFWARISIGAVVGVVLTRPIHASFQALFLPLTTNPDAIRALPALPVTRGDWQLLISGNAMLMMFWIGGGLFFSRFLGFAPFSKTSLGGAAAVSQPSIASPLVVTKLSRLSFDDVNVIQAEDHYLRLSGGKGEELILYRFADAVAELAPLRWTRIHRSYCVRDNAVAGRQTRGRTLELIMQSGQHVPVSERYRAVADKLLV
jgi:LytTr DNA-binding domain